jgi:FMN reductase
MPRSVPHDLPEPPSQGGKQMSLLRITSLTGNPRPDSRTHGLARTLTGEIGRVLGATPVTEVDLAPFGPRVLDPSDAVVTAAVEKVLAADLLVVASPTYKATYSGLLKAFLDRLGTGSLAGAAAVPVLLGGAQNHRLAVDVHFAPLLLELGAAVPVRGLFVLEAEVGDFGSFAAAWADAHATALLAATRAAPSLVTTP